MTYRPECMHTLLASATPAGKPDVTGMLIAIGLLIAAIIVLSIILMALRRRMLAANRQDPVMGVFEELRRLHASGELSDEEFERARSRIIARAKGETPHPTNGKRRAE